MNIFYYPYNKKQLIASLFSILLLSSCSQYRNTNNKTDTTFLQIDLIGNTSKTHFKNNDYTLSINSKIANPLIERLKGGQDSLLLVQDTIDLQLLHPYWTGKELKRELRKCTESNEIEIYWHSKSKHIQNIKRTTSRPAYKGIHRYYMYSNPENNDTILLSYSFDTDTPPF